MEKAISKPHYGLGHSHQARRMQELEKQGIVPVQHITHDISRTWTAWILWMFPGCADNSVILFTHATLEDVPNNPSCQV